MVLLLDPSSPLNDKSLSKSGKNFNFSNAFDKKMQCELEIVQNVTVCQHAHKKTNNHNNNNNKKKINQNDQQVAMVEREIFPFTLQLHFS